MTLDRLKRFLERPKRPPGEACQYCDADIGNAHSHVVGIESRELLCACRACYLLFTHEGAAGGKYRAVPDRHLQLSGGGLTEPQWDRLQIPVGIAFFFFNSSRGRTVAFYPGPAGATESELPLEAWTEVVAGNPALADLARDVEALLVHRNAPDDFDLYIVPIDRCYELVGRIRMHWKGFDGGEEARRAIDAFFASVRERCEGTFVDEGPWAS